MTTRQNPLQLCGSGLVAIGLAAACVNAYSSVRLMRLISDTNKRRYAFKPVSCARSGNCISSAGAGISTQLEIEHHPLGRGHAGLNA